MYRIVFDLENKPGLVGEKGALIGIPHRHATLIYPINNLGVVNATNELIPVIAGMNEEGPGSISSELFWYHDGEYARLPYRIEENKLTFSPPEPFIDMLNTLQSAT